MDRRFLVLVDLSTKDLYKSHIAKLLLQHPRCLVHIVNSVNIVGFWSQGLVLKRPVVVIGPGRTIDRWLSVGMRQHFYFPHIMVTCDEFSPRQLMYVNYLKDKSLPSALIKLCDPAFPIGDDGEPGYEVSPPSVLCDFNSCGDPLIESEVWTFVESNILQREEEVLS